MIGRSISSIGTGDRQQLIVPVPGCNLDDPADIGPAGDGVDKGSRDAARLVSREQPGGCGFVQCG
jgi:hypothetical protein